MTDQEAVEAREAEASDALNAEVHGSDALTADEVPIWREAAKTLTAPKTLEKIAEHNKFILSSVATIGTVLTGFGAVTATVAVTRSTYLVNGVPVVSVGALLTTALAATSVAIALFARRPVFRRINANNLVAVKKFYLTEVNRSKGTVKWASWLFSAAAFLAAATACVAMLLVITHSNEPRNLASLSTVVGAEGVVTVKVGGTVDGLGNGDVVSVKVVSGSDPASTESPLISMQISPDKEGVATLAGEAQAPAEESEVTAVIDVLPSDDEHFDPLTSTYPAVPPAAASSSNQATLSLTSGQKVVGHLGGALSGIQDGTAVKVRVTAGRPGTKEGITVASITAYPAVDGSVDFDTDISPVPSKSRLRAVITVHTVEGGILSADATDTYVVDAGALGRRVREQ